jgi:hypothetical protein
MGVEAARRARMERLLAGTLRNILSLHLRSSCNRMVVSGSAAARRPRAARTGRGQDERRAPAVKLEHEGGDACMPEEDADNYVVIMCSYFKK